MALSDGHQVLQAAFGWEYAHLYRFFASDPPAPRRPIVRTLWKQWQSRRAPDHGAQASRVAGMTGSDSPWPQRSRTFLR